MEGDDNVVQFPSTPARRFRVSKNKLSDYLFGSPEEFKGDDEPMHTPSKNHAAHKGLANKEEGTGVSEDGGYDVKEAGPNTKATVLNHLSGRGHLEELNTGINEAKILSMDKFIEKRNAKRMENPDA